MCIHHLARISLVSLLFSVFAHAASPPNPVELFIDDPKFADRNIFALDADWELRIRLHVRSADAFIAPGLAGSHALVTSDPDGCLDARDFFGGLPLEDCPGPDETWFPYTPERYDDAGVPDNDDAYCTGEREAALREGPFDPAAIPTLQQPYVSTGLAAPFYQPVGPAAGGTASDCFGYGASEDIPGLVIMADVGGARIFDANFDLLPSAGEIRNLAGFTNHVAYEFLFWKKISAVTASIRVNSLFERITLVDQSVAAPATDVLFRQESGPIQSWKAPDGLSFDDWQDELAALLVGDAENDFMLRAVLVQGQAPDTIIDMDGDGRYTSTDLELAGYTILSNQVKRRFITKITKLTDLRALKGVDSMPFFYPVDLDGDGQAPTKPFTPSSRAGVRVRR